MNFLLFTAYILGLLALSSASAVISAHEKKVIDVLNAFRPLKPLISLLEPSQEHRDFKAATALISYISRNDDDEKEAENSESNLVKVNFLEPIKSAFGDAYADLSVESIWNLLSTFGFDGEDVLMNAAFTGNFSEKSILCAIEQADFPAFFLVKSPLNTTAKDLKEMSVVASKTITFRYIRYPVICDEYVVFGREDALISILEMDETNPDFPDLNLDIESTSIETSVIRKRIQRENIKTILQALKKLTPLKEAELSFSPQQHDEVDFLKKVILYVREEDNPNNLVRNISKHCLPVDPSCTRLHCVFTHFTKLFKSSTTSQILGFKLDLVTKEEDVKSDESDLVLVLSDVDSKLAPEITLPDRKMTKSDAISLGKPFTSRELAVYGEVAWLAEKVQIIDLKSQADDVFEDIDVDDDVNLFEPVLIKHMDTKKLELLVKSLHKPIQKLQFDGQNDDSKKALAVQKFILGETKDLPVYNDNPYLTDEYCIFRDMHKESKVSGILAEPKHVYYRLAETASEPTNADITALRKLLTSNVENFEDYLVFMTHTRHSIDPLLGFCHTRKSSKFKLVIRFS